VGASVPSTHEPSGPATGEGRRVSFGDLVFGIGPRFARDALGPVLVFYTGWKLVGLSAGIAAATFLALVAFAWERRRGRTGLMPGIGLGVALVQAVVGLVSGNPRAYLAPPVIVNAFWGLLFIGSTVAGRPLAGVLAQEAHSFPPELRASRIFSRVFGHVSLVWGTYFLARSAVRLAALLWSNIEVFIVVNVLTGFPFAAGLMSWSLWYPLRAFRAASNTPGQHAGPTIRVSPSIDHR
jgi:intracellular septation protein A